MVHVVVLLGIVVEEGQLGNGMVPYTNEDTVVAVAVVRLGDSQDETHDNPHHENGAVVMEERL